MGNKKVFSSLKKIEVYSDWFKVYKLPYDVFAIYEPFHYQEVISYLILGSDKALLFDTGMGIGNIKNIIDKLTNLPLTVVNSHIHFDHVGCNYLFEEVYVFSTEAAKNRLKTGYSTKELMPHAKNKLFSKVPPENFDINNYFIKPSNPKLIHNNHIFDLGNRNIEVLHTPGHSSESIMLLDHDNKILFTGDTYYPGPLYAHYDGAFYGKSSLKDYAETLRKVCKFVPELITIHPSHNVPIADPSILIKVSEALDSLVDGKAVPGKLLNGDLTIASLPDTGEIVDGYIIPDDLYIYTFDGFEIISRKCHL